MHRGSITHTILDHVAEIVSSRWNRLEKRIYRSGLDGSGHTLTTHYHGHRYPASSHLCVTRLSTMKCSAQCAYSEI